MSSFEQPTNFTSRGKEKKSSLGASPFRLAKSPLHRKIQIFLQKSYGGDDLYLEKKFPSLRRTADIVLMGQKKIIEVQTSLIGIKEMMERERDYRSLGFEVIWLLYDKVFFCDPLPLITRFFFAKRAFIFSFHDERLFQFHDLDRHNVSVDVFFRRKPFYQKIYPFLKNLFFQS
jgi:competence CoiA-like predicted nuclease